MVEVVLLDLMKDNYKIELFLKVTKQKKQIITIVQSINIIMLVHNNLIEGIEIG